jgi:hypothetical protein
MSKTQSIKERLLSDENIFLAINYVKSYILNEELLSTVDQNYLEHLKDIYNVKLITTTIARVKSTLLKLIEDEESFFTITAYFKPKKINSEKEIIYRPLHTSSLINQISMVSMLQIIIFDYKDSTIIPSEISKLIPSNFYGNRISYDTKTLFKPWQEQYKKYTTNANDIYVESLKNKKFKYEVVLDLENFFPSINPLIFYNYLISKIPITIIENDLIIYKRIIYKLLFFELDNNFSDIECKWYYSKLRCNLKVNKYFAKGLPQGLPHTYYFANLFMLLIKDIYKKHFPGESFYYVDDSICFTNSKYNKSNFKKEIRKINKELKNLTDSYLQKQKTPNYYNYNKTDFEIKVHEDSKSFVAEIEKKQLNSGMMYLNSISRECSTFNFDYFSSNSDEEINILKNKTNIILKQIENEICRISKLSSSKDQEKDNTIQKLIRYRNFFKLRAQILKIKTMEINSQDIFKFSKIFEEENKIIKTMNKIVKDKQKEELIEQLTNDILLSTLNILLKFHQEAQLLYTNSTNNKNEIWQAIKELNQFAYSGYTNYSYILKSIDKYNSDIEQKEIISKYKTLNRTVNKKLQIIKNQQYKNKVIYFDKLLEKYNSNPKYIYTLIDLEYIFNKSTLIRNKNDNLTRVVFNSIYSYIFSYTPNDSFGIEKIGNSQITYFELLTICHLRNNSFRIKDFNDNYIQYKNDDYLSAIDYSVLQILPIFKTFVRDFEKIKNLILIHKYCCDTWKNGSKYLHFYTLHNQEHAINLIDNSIHLIHSFSYLQLKKLDFYILFASCYLHDISMVSLPDYNMFSNQDNLKSNEIYTKFYKEFEEANSINSTYQDRKKVLCDTYKEIDSFFEQNIRNEHAFSSAKGIRTFEELKFITPAIRELIAEVSQSHGYNSEDIYHSRSQAKTSLISLKYLKILLRLSDLLDLSKYRISKVILNHNLKELDNTSRFHWISHLLTDGYKINNEYKSNINSENDNEYSYIGKKSIEEKIILEIEILIAQTTEIKQENKPNSKQIIYSECCKDSYGKPTITLKFDESNQENISSSNFLCQWFKIKNQYLIEELIELKKYLNSIDDYFFKTDIEIKIVVKSNENIPNDIFDYLKDYIEDYDN